MTPSVVSLMLISLQLYWRAGHRFVVVSQFLHEAVDAVLPDFGDEGVSFREEKSATGPGSAPGLVRASRTDRRSDRSHP